MSCQRALLALLILASGCTKRHYAFRDLGQVAVAVNRKQVLPADPSVNDGRLGGSTIRRTNNAVFVDGHAVVENGRVTLNHDTTWSGADHDDQPSSPDNKPQLRLLYDHVISAGVQPAAPGMVYKFTKYYDIMLTTSWSNVRVVDRHGTAPKLGLALIVLGGTSLATGGLLGAVGIGGDVPVYLDIGGIIGVVGGIALMWPRDHERWNGQ